MHLILYQSVRDRRVRHFEAPRMGVWVHVETPTHQERDWLATTLNLPAGVLRDALDPYEVPRYEEVVVRGKPAVVLFVRYPAERNGELTTAPLTIVATEEMVITISPRPFPLVNRWCTEGVLPAPTTQRTKLVLELLRHVVAAYTRALTHIQRRVLKHRAHPHEVGEGALDAFLHDEATVQDFLDALIPMQGAFTELLHHRTLPLYEEDQELVEDLRLAIGQLLERSRSVRVAIQAMREAFVAATSHQLNLTMKRLTALTVILAILTVVTSVWGMNVALPFEHLSWGFWVVVSIAVASAVSAMLFFRRRGWL